MREFPASLDVMSLRILVKQEPEDKTVRDLLTDALFEWSYGTFSQCRWAAREVARRALVERDFERVSSALTADGIRAVELREAIRVRTPGCGGSGFRIELVRGAQSPTVVGDLGYFLEEDGNQIVENECDPDIARFLVYVAGDRRIVVGATWVVGAMGLLVDFALGYLIV